jgi:hypothetical protein
MLQVLRGIILVMNLLQEMRERDFKVICTESYKGLIKIFPIDTKDQIADTLTKSLAQNDFQLYCRYMSGA